MTGTLSTESSRLHTDSMYGCLCLSALDKTPIIDFPFDSLAKIEKGNHLRHYSESTQQEFDYVIGGGSTLVEPEYAKLSNVSRGITISGFRIGDHTEENPTKQIIYRLLTLNTDNTEDERDLPYLDLVYSKISKALSGRFFSIFDIRSSRSKFVIISKNIPVYMFVACNDTCMYLFWSNEETLRHRMRENYGNAFFYYTLTPMVNGTLVIQSLYLRRWLAKWRLSLHTDLKVLNVLDEYLVKKTISTL